MANWPRADAAPRGRMLHAEDAMAGGMLYEIKVDGVRAIAWGGPDGVELWSRRGNRLTERFPERGPALAAAVPAGVTLDGEVCASPRHHTPAARAHRHCSDDCGAFDYARPDPLLCQVQETGTEIGA